jgi:hypothetical protein
MMISLEERLAIKLHCGELAMAFNDQAAYWAGLAVFFPPVGLFSAAYWILANQYQALANDPPRLDFDKIELAHTNDPAIMHGGDTVLKVGATLLQCAQSISKVIVSLERHDGGASSAKVPAKLVARRSALAEVQLAALEHNGRVVIHHQSTIASLQDATNAEWARGAAVLAQGTAPPTVAEVRAANQRRGDGALHLMQSLLGWKESDLASLLPKRPHPIFDQSYAVVFPAKSVDDSVITSLSKSSAALSGLVID